jgi:four-jointed box protein 1
MLNIRSIQNCEDLDRDTADSMWINSRRRKLLQRQACLLSVLAAFTLGVALGIFLPLMKLSSWDAKSTRKMNNSPVPYVLEQQQDQQFANYLDDTNNENEPKSSVSFVMEEKVSLKDAFRNAFHLQSSNDKNTLIVKKLNPTDGNIIEYSLKRTADGYFQKSIEKVLAKKPHIEEALNFTRKTSGSAEVNFVGRNSEQVKKSDFLNGIIRDDIYWGMKIENSLPHGYYKNEFDDWYRYIESAEVERLEVGCGRMQNRMVVFKDGSRACVRYRQNTDQIQGEIFSFYLGRLLNLPNLAPSAASIIDISSKLWSSAARDIINTQWKTSRPVVITKWIPDLQLAGIPKPFQPLERHLNKFDIQNITLGWDETKSEKGLLKLLSGDPYAPKNKTTLNETVKQRLLELAQWSDLIIFDYLIANLDRVVNNLYNFQWNADIMAAPAHNLAKQSDSQLLLFLDNESGLLHGYRLLKKYEAYHGLLLDNLCVFRKTTIDLLKNLRDTGIGEKINSLFEQTTSENVRDILPPLPEKSIKILVDRVDRVLGQVQKCREVFSTR